MQESRVRVSSLPPFRLDLRSAAVNEQFDTRDETGVIRREKQRHLSNFLGFPHASHRDGRHNPRNQVCRLPTRQRRIDRTRTNNVLIASTGGTGLLPAYTLNFLLSSVTSRPLKGDTPTVDLVLGYKKSNQSPILKLLLSRLDELVARVSKMAL